MSLAHPNLTSSLHHAYTLLISNNALPAFECRSSVQEPLKAAARLRWRHLYRPRADRHRPRSSKCCDLIGRANLICSRKHVSGYMCFTQTNEVGWLLLGECSSYA